MRFFPLVLAFLFFLVPTAHVQASQAPSATLGSLANSTPAPPPSPFPKLQVGWENLYDFGILGGDSFRAVAVDSQGNAIAVGSSLGGISTFSYETLITKYDALGNLVWVRRYDSPGSGFADTAVDVAIDGNDDIVVLATGPTNSGDQDILLFRYDAAGNLLWQSIWSNNWSDSATALVIAADGSIYVLGTSYYGLPEVSNVVLLKWSAQGQLLWEQNYDGHGGTDEGRRLALDNQGNILVAGKTIHTAGTTNFDWLGLKYDSAGNLLWVFEQGGAALWPDELLDMTVTSAGEMVMTGYFVNTVIGFGGETDPTTILVDAQGNLRWETTQSVQGSGRWLAVTTDANDQIFVTGEPSLVACMEPAFGQTLWTRTVQNTGALYTSPKALLVDGRGNLLVASTTSTFAQGTNIFLQSLQTQSGALLDSLEYGGNYDQDVAASENRSMALAGSNRIVLVGTSANIHDDDALILNLVP